MILLRGKNSNKQAQYYTPPFTFSVQPPSATHQRAQNKTNFSSAKGYSD